MSSPLRVAKRTTTSSFPLVRGETAIVSANPSGALCKPTREPSLIPSFWGSGVWE
jgi:hypothetical protein